MSEENYNKQSCDMARVPDVDALFYAPIGGFSINHANDAGESLVMMWLKLPSGGMSCICVRGTPKPGRPVWQWDGNEDKPTLQPSVHQVGEWHGWIRNGRMESC